MGQKAHLWNSGSNKNQCQLAESQLDGAGSEGKDRSQCSMWMHKLWCKVGFLLPFLMHWSVHLLLWRGWFFKGKVVLGYVEGSQSSQLAFTINLQNWFSFFSSSPNLARNILHSRLLGGFHISCWSSYVYLNKRLTDQSHQGSVWLKNGFKVCIQTTSSILKVQWKDITLPLSATLRQITLSFRSTKS